MGGVWLVIVPALCVGTPLGTLRVPRFAVTQSVTVSIPTRSVGMIIAHKQKGPLNQRAFFVSAIQIRT